MGKASSDRAKIALKIKGRLVTIQWNPAITMCHGTGKNVRYSGVFVIAKTPL